jgi:chemotaxis protein histidine kinase CheA
MISVIETDSEKLSQIFSQIVKNRDQLKTMAAELQKVGIEFDPEALIKEPSRTAAIPAETAEKVPVMAKKVVTEKVTPIAKESSAVKPQILSASEFKKVDDMIGFLSKRKKKTVQESDVPDEVKKTAAPIRSGGGDEGVASDSEDFFSEFREEFKQLETAMSQLRTNLGRTRYLVELADSFGEFKRIGKIFELPRFSRVMQAFEKSLIDVADNADGKRSGMNETAFGALHQMAVLFKGIEPHKKFPLPSGFLEDVQALHDQFVTSVSQAERIVSEETRGVVKIEDVEAEIKQSSEADEERSIALPISGIDTDDFQIFKDEASYTFETIRTAVQKLKASGSDHDAIKDIQQSFRSLFTGSRLLRFSVLTGHFDLILRQLKTCIDSQNAIAPELLHLIEETLKFSAELIRGEQIREEDWDKLKMRLEKFGTQKELPGETPAEFRVEPAKTKPSEKSVKKDEPAETADSILVSNTNWIDQFQKTLENHPFELKEEVKEIPAKTKPLVEVKAAEAH